MSYFFQQPRQTFYHIFIQFYAFLILLAGFSLIISSKGKFWKAFPKISVNAVDTNSLISGLVIANPGCQAPLMTLSKIPSKKSLPWSKFVMCSFKFPIDCTSTFTCTFDFGILVIVVVCTRSSATKYQLYFFQCIEKFKVETNQNWKMMSIKL